MYVLSIAAAATLTWLVRRGRRTVVALTATATALQLIAQVTWLSLILPVNVRLRALPPGEVPADLAALRAQWEYTHALGFVLFTAAFLALVSALQAQPAATPSARVLERAR